MSTVSDPRNVQVTFTYNKDNTLNLKHYSLPVGGDVAPTSDVNYAWDPNFVRLLSIANGNSFNAYQYNSYITSSGGTTYGGGALHQETKAADSNPMTAIDWTISYSYDILGRTTSRDIDGQTTSWTFDPISRVTSETNPLSSTALTFNYVDQSSTTDKGNGLLSSIVYPNGQTANFSYGSSCASGRTRGSAGGGNVICC